MRHSLYTSVGILVLSLPTAGVAQTAPASPAAAAKGAAASPVDSGEIVVTAQKRAERLRDVPLAVSAYSGTALQAQQITTATDLRLISPSLNFTPSANARGEGFSIRGVGTAIFSDTVEQSVGVVVDGVVLGRSGQATGDLLDLDRVEILRGPQGMLFGKNASAGLISITTRRPQLNATTLDFNASYATLNELKLSAIANAPLGPYAALRIAASSQTADGIISNITRNEKLNNRNEQNARAKLLLEPGNGLSVYLIGDYQKRRSRCCAWTARSAPLTTTFGRLNAAIGIVPSVGNRINGAGAEFFQNVDAYGTSGEVNYDLGFATLTSITAYRHWKNSDNNDPDILPINILDVNSGVSRLNQFSQELRITSPAGPIEYVAGVFYYHQRNKTNNNQTGTLGAVALPSVLGTTLDTNTENESKAIFGQMTVRPMRGIKLIAGARYTDEQVDLVLTQARAPGTVAGIPGRFNGTINGATGATNLSYRLTGQVDVSRDMMIYVTHARGFKGPGINTLGVTTSVTEVVAPEIPTTYEIGSRGAWWNNRVTLNVAAFKTDYKNFQAQVFDQGVFPGRFRVTNAGKLNTKGVEAELSLRPIPPLTLSANAAYINARYGDFRNIACFTGQTILPFGTVRSDDRQCIRISAAPGATAVTNGTGNRLSNTPKLTYSLFGRFEQPVGNLKAFVQASYQWRDGVSFSAAGDPNLVQKSFGLLNGSLGIGDAEGRWTATLFAKNLFDKFYATNIISQPVLNAPGVYSQFYTPDSRRLIGVSLGVKLGR
ncbi:MAG: TonB-dependent receptor [Sphingomonas bacterium]|nr:TonB-dependent receptor [Sphingomonas bacterium]